MRLWKQFFFTSEKLSLVLGICKRICVSLNLINHWWKWEKKTYYWLNLNNIQYLSSQRWFYKRITFEVKDFSFYHSVDGLFSYILWVKCLIFGKASEFNQKWKKFVSDVIKLYSIKYLCLQGFNFHVVSVQDISSFCHSLGRVLCLSFFLMLTNFSTSRFFPRRSRLVMHLIKLP